MEPPLPPSIEQRVLVRIGAVGVGVTIGVLLFAVWAGVVFGLGWLIFTTIWGLLT
jgi:hypothetical protein